jgi:hypothetical protein
MIGYVLHFGYREIMEMRIDKAKKYYRQSIEILEAKNKRS